MKLLHPLIAVACLTATRLASADDSAAGASGGATHSPEAVAPVPWKPAHLDGLMASGTLKQRIGMFSTYIHPAVGDRFAIDLSNLPKEQIQFSHPPSDPAAEDERHPPYVPFHSPLILQQVAADAIRLSAVDGQNKLIIEIDAGKFLAGSPAKIYFYEETSGRIRCMAEAEGSLTLKSAQPAELTPLGADDPINPALEQWQAAVTERYRKGGVTEPHFRPWREIASESARRLFPGLRFATIRWNEEPAPGAGQERAARAGLLYVTLAINVASGETHELPGYGNHEEFGTLLSDLGVKIQSAEDAALVWSAYRDVLREPGQDPGVEQVSARLWHFGTSVSGRFRYYYRVDLNEDHKVTHGKLIADPVNPE